MSRAQKLRQQRYDDIPDYETFDFSPLTEEDPLKACMLLKFGRKGHAHEAIVRLSKDKTYVEWEGRWFTRKKPGERRVYLEQASRVQAGQTTPPFERLKQYFGEAEKNSFSIIYGDDRSLDLIAPTPEMYKLWFDGLRSCLQHIKDVHEFMDVDKRFLKEKFDQADTDKSGNVTRKEVQKLVSGMNIPITSKAINKIFKDVDRDKTGTLDFDEFTEFMGQLRRRPELEIIWDFMVENKIVGEIRTLKELGLKDDGDYDFQNKAKAVALDVFMSFWNTLQAEAITEKIGKDMINDVMTNHYHGKAPVLTYMGWITLITQDDNDAYDPEKRKFHPDIMTRPLSHYFIASSHNTYLTGDQLQSQSSVNRYIDDLCKNCRCVELDCWDGETEDQEPVIYHGHTLTTKIKFEDVVIAIKNYAFKNSPYPLVLSIENHCSLVQQEKMAQMFIYEFGNLLLHPDEFPCENLGNGNVGDLPTIDKLKKKIIIKGKVIKKGDLDEEDEDEDDDEEEEDEDASTTDGATPGSKSHRKKFTRGQEFQSGSAQSVDSSSNSLGESSASLSTIDEDEHDEDGGADDQTTDDSASVISDSMSSSNLSSVTGGSGRSLGRDSSSISTSTNSVGGGKKKKGRRGMNRKSSSGSSSSFSRSESNYSNDSSTSFDTYGRKKKKEKKLGTHPALSAITFLGTCKHKSFAESINNTPCNMMSSFSEGKTLKLLKKSKSIRDWQTHNTKHVSRIYPKGSRVDSSNMDPMPAWAAGNHMVALNYQTAGEPMQLNDAKFRENGGCGYVLKPEYMLNPNLSPSSPILLKVHVISGQQLPKVTSKIMTEVVDPYVTVSIHGMPKDNQLKKTRTVKNNGFNPLWDEVFEFKIRHPDVAQLMFRVYDEDSAKNTSEFMAYSSIPLLCLRTGLRSVSLFDEKGNRKGDFAFASLVIRTEYVEVQMEEETEKDDEDVDKSSSSTKHKATSHSSFGESVRSFASVRSAVPVEDKSRDGASGKFFSVSSSDVMKSPTVVDDKFVSALSVDDKDHERVSIQSTVPEAEPVSR